MQPLVSACAVIMSAHATISLCTCSDHQLIEPGLEAKGVPESSLDPRPSFRFYNGYAKPGTSCLRMRQSFRQILTNGYSRSLS